MDAQANGPRSGRATDSHRRRRSWLLGAEPRPEPRGVARLRGRLSLRPPARSHWRRSLGATPSVPCTTRLRGDPARRRRSTRSRSRRRFPRTHSLAMAALEAGKHVFVEKPLAASSEQVDRADRRSPRRRASCLMPGHTFLYSPAVTTIKRLIDCGELGEIYFISSSRVNLGLHQPDVSVVWDLGPHDFSILRYWLDALPAEVSAVSRSCLLPGRSGRLLHQPSVPVRDCRARRAFLARAEQASADGDRRVGEDGRLRRHLERVGPDLRLRRDDSRSGDIRRVPA